MERAKHRIIFILVIIMCCGKLTASYRSEIYYAYISNKMELWKNVIDRMDAMPDKSNEFILELVNYQYGYIGYCLGYNKKSDARKYLDLAQKNIDILEKRGYKLSVLDAYKSAFCAFKMGLNIFSVPINGLKSIEYAKSAIKIDRENYFGYVQYGNIEFYMPSSFGGSKKEGIDFYLKAKEILEKNIANTKENWNYLSLLIVIGQSYYYLNDYASAKAVYESILLLEPGFIYVRDELYPQLLKKMKS
jgi:tetratricopeptide (TPR) repeat protein